MTLIFLYGLVCHALLAAIAVQSSVAYAGATTLFAGSDEPHAARADNITLYEDGSLRIIFDRPITTGQLLDSLEDNGTKLSLYHNHMHPLFTYEGNGSGLGAGGGVD
jgi:hypothetical protein